MHDIKENEFPAVLEQYESLSHSLFLQLEIILCSWPVFPQEAIFMPMVWITTKGHVKAPGLCCHLKSC